MAFGRSNEAPKKPSLLFKLLLVLPKQQLMQAHLKSFTLRVRRFGNLKCPAIGLAGEPLLELTLQLWKLLEVREKLVNQEAAKRIC